MSLKRNQTLDLHNDSFYKGSIKNGVPHGTGQIKTPYSILKGKWKEGSMNGRGQIEVNLNHINVPKHYK